MALVIIIGGADDATADAKGGPVVVDGSGVGLAPGTLPPHTVHARPPGTAVDDADAAGGQADPVAARQWNSSVARARRT